MANTYTQLYIQLVFAVKYRQSFIRQEWKERLYQYLTTTIQNAGHKMLAINGMPDHIHIFFGLNPSVSISDVVRDSKRATNNWINQNRLTKKPFAWQGGYGAFSYSRSQVSQVYRYIESQEVHHAKTTFRVEYMAMLKAFDIEFTDEYLFEFYD